MRHRCAIALVAGGRLRVFGHRLHRQRHLPAADRQATADTAPFAAFCWVLVGIAAIRRTMLWDRVARRAGATASLSPICPPGGRRAAASGLAAPQAKSLASGAILGGTFMGIVTVANGGRATSPPSNRRNGRADDGQPTASARSSDHRSQAILPPRPAVSTSDSPSRRRPAAGHRAPGRGRARAARLSSDQARHRRRAARRKMQRGGEFARDSELSAFARDIGGCFRDNPCRMFLTIRRTVTAMRKARAIPDCLRFRIAATCHVEAFPHRPLVHASTPSARRLLRPLDARAGLPRPAIGTCGRDDRGLSARIGVPSGRLRGAGAAIEPGAGLRPARSTDLDSDAAALGGNWATPDAGAPGTLLGRFRAAAHKGPGSRRMPRSELSRRSPLRPPTMPPGGLTRERARSRLNA